MKGNRDRFFGLYAHFDPKLISLQIICNSLVYYCGLTLLYLLLDTCFGIQFHIGQFFHYSIYDTEHMYGMISLISNLFNMAIVIIGLYVITEKANKVLDFVFTTYFIHFMICVFYNGTIFLSWRWFITNGIIMVLTIFTGEYVLLHGEQQEIKLFEDIMSPTSVDKKNKPTHVGIELNNSSAMTDSTITKINMA